MAIFGINSLDLGCILPNCTNLKMIFPFESLMFPFESMIFPFPKGKDMGVESKIEVGPQNGW